MHKAAFFDVDNTLINIKSMFNFYQYWASAKGYQKKYNLYIANFEKEVKANVARTILNKNYYKEFENESLDELYSQGKDWFEYIFTNKQLFIQETLKCLNQHKINGYKIIFVSGSMLPLLEPIANYLHVDKILCTTLDVVNGKLTGNIRHPQTISEGKSVAIKEYARFNDINLLDSYAYGDDISDVPMLLSVGHPVCVGSNIELLKYAQKMNWEILPINTTTN